MKRISAVVSLVVETYDDAGRLLDRSPAQPQEVVGLSAPAFLDAWAALGKQIGAAVGPSEPTGEDVDGG